MASYRIHQPASLDDEVQRIAKAQVERALASLGELGPGEAVHDVRKRCKKVRALLRLVEASMEGRVRKQENARFREIASCLSGARETSVVVETFDDLLAAYDHPFDETTVGPVREALVGSIPGEASELDEQMVVARERLTEAGDRISAWSLDDDGVDAWRGGFVRSYARGRRGLDAAVAAPSTEGLHEWRKRVKDHGYHLRILQDCWPRELTGRREAFEELGELLGLDHDLAALRDLLTDRLERRRAPRGAAALRALADDRRAQVQARAMALGTRCFAESPSALAERVSVYWHVWAQEHGDMRGGRRASPR